jgi:ribonuclease E
LAKEKIKKDSADVVELMVVNESPGEECRIAILQDHHLEELYSERTSSATDVGNIYKGRVTNVEPAIQAAFIDYGKGQSGFLHISDLHPRYFPRGDRTESVGRKIPRRDRPLMQEALRRGDEVLVQVLKQGIGTKGPTLTSYLSVPGRLLVMMPGMDRVGVSRRVEDEEQRRAMRDILDQLDLPDGFGFILRTAGFGATKTDLKRDVAYLMRLWKLMEKRRTKLPAPCELYAESDLLTRTVRDVLRPTIKAIVVDSRTAAKRAEAFLNVVTPRSAPQVIYYTNPTPIFHAFDIERQIDQIHSRKVPLQSGGELVIDQTEALVAIDVNSGRSRAARDSETNAYQTNCEAVDEICRQLRLRDLGGLIINDLIDMRSPGHRRDIEDRFRLNLKRDRAKTTILRISEFGIVEMTRQRMRPSLRKTHFMACPHCDGRGEIKTPESVASGSVRHVAFLLQYDRVRRVEMVCSLQVASVMLSTKRRELVRLEDQSGKKVHVRVSEAFAADRVDYYAYDERNADIDIARLPIPALPSLDQLARTSDVAKKTVERRLEAAAEPESEGRGDAMAALADEEEDFDLLEDEEFETAEAGADGEPGGGGQDAQRKRRRRGRRGGRGRRRGQQPQAEGASIGPKQPIVQAQDDRDDDSRDSSEMAAPLDVDTDAVERVAAENEDAARQAEAMRVHELAKELGVTSREIVERCQDDGVSKVKSHMSSVASVVADQMRRWFGMGRAEAEIDDEISVDEQHAEPVDDRDAFESAPSEDDAGAEDDIDVADDEQKAAAAAQDESAAGDATGDEGQRGRRRRRRRGRGRRSGGEGSGNGQGAEDAAPTKQPRPMAPKTEPVVKEEQAGEGGPPKPRSRRGRRGGRGRGRKGGEQQQQQPAQPQPAAADKNVQPKGGEGGKPASERGTVQVVRPRRRLYGSRSKLSAGDLPRDTRSED